VAQVIEHLLCECEALNSNPSPTKKKKIEDLSQILRGLYLSEFTILKIRMELVTMAHACNPSYSGGRDQGDCGLKPARANSSERPYLLGGGEAQVVRVLGEQTQGHEFKPQCCQKKKRERERKTLS
jgi:hypothetical protein